MRTYKRVGAGPFMLRCYQRYQQFCAVHKLDLMCQVQFVAYSMLGLHQGSWQWWLSLVVHVPIAIAWLPIGIAAVRLESRALTHILITVALLQPPLYAAQLLSSEGGSTLVHDGAATAHGVRVARAMHGVEASVDSPPLSTATATWMHVGTPSWLFGGSVRNCTFRLFAHSSPEAQGRMAVLTGALLALAVITRLLLLSAALLVRSSFGHGLALSRALPWPTTSSGAAAESDPACSITSASSLLHAEHGSFGHGGGGSGLVGGGSGVVGDGSGLLRAGSTSCTSAPAHAWTEPGEQQPAVVM